MIFVSIALSLNTDYASFVRKMSQGIRFYNNANLPHGYTTADDGCITFPDVRVLQGDIVHIAGTSSSPYGCFGATLFKGNYGNTMLQSNSSNSIQPLNVTVGSTSQYDAYLTLRITPAGTKPDTVLSSLYITVISCQMFYR